MDERGIGDGRRVRWMDGQTDGGSDGHMDSQTDNKPKH